MADSRSRALLEFHLHQEAHLSALGLSSLGCRLWAVGCGLLVIGLSAGQAVRCWPAWPSPDESAEGRLKAVGCRLLAVGCWLTAVFIPDGLNFLRPLLHFHANYAIVS
jgi:hypothetical protein